MNRLDFNQLFRALPSPHMILNRDLSFVAVNPAYETVTMQTSAELVGHGLFERFPSTPANEARLRGSIERVFASGKPDTLAFIKYELPRPAGDGMETRYWTAVHSPLFDDAGNVIFVLQNTVDITDLARLREAASLPFRIVPEELELVQRAREAEEAYRATQGESTDFSRVFQKSPNIVAVLQGPDHIFTFANDVFRRFIGERDVLGMPIREALPEIVGQGFFKLLDTVYESGNPDSGEARRIFLKRTPTGPAEEAFMDFSCHPVLDLEGRVTGIFIQGADRTDSVRASDRQRLLLDELNHRVKNTLSAVQSIARQSFRRGLGADEAQATFDARIQALSKAHDVLSDRHWEGVDLKTIVMQELTVYESERVKADGPLVRLSPKDAIAFAMVFHELSSNASKYGALSSSDGEIEVSWSRPGRDPTRLRVDWIEKGVISGDRSLQPGFGIRMLERIVQGEFDGRFDLAFSRTGLICGLDVSLTKSTRLADGAPASCRV